ncbi:MAG TPA: SWIM zinc finger family protein, partial [Solirubrobacterales bacterium]|nr:SWIM zinc finger family protein [Solirubrobacterales bacterium]
MHGTIEVRSAVDLSEVREAVGSRSFGRGRSYERNQSVVAIEWDPSDLTLTGSVAGTTLYTTTTYFAEANGSLAFEDGECTCPVGYNCKHVAAIVIAAAGEGAGAQNARLGLRARTAASDAPAWEESLRALIDIPAAPAGERPLAIELSLRSGGAPGRRRPRLMARLMRPGARGGWVNGSLSWGRLDSWHVREGEYRSDHLALVRELYAVYRARDQRAGYYYDYRASDDRALDLSDCDSPHLWWLLDEATRIELRLIHALPRLGDLPPYGRGELLVDVGHDGERGSFVTAVLGLGDDDAAQLEPLLFLGASGHGVVCAEPDEGRDDPDLEHRRLRLVRLAGTAPPQLQRMVLDGERLEIPAGELDRFAVEICPALRHVATVVSSDGSFTPPEISEPTLVLRTSYDAGHALELEWAWAYRVGSQTRHVPLGIGAAGPGFRDRGAERAILAETVLPETGLERLGLLDAAARPAETPAVSLAGTETMRLTTEVLPRLEERGVAVEVEGEPADYRDVGESLEIGVSTTEVAGERDWFDLGVTISVEGREL